MYYMTIFLEVGSFRRDLGQVWHKFQVNYQTKEWYIVADILKYRSNNLIIFYCYTYSELLSTAEVVIQNSIELRGM